MDHLDMLGRSIADPVVVSYLADQEKLDPVDFQKNAEIGFFGGFDSGFGLTAESLLTYKAHFEEVRSRCLPDDGEMIVTRLSFTGPDAIRSVQRPYRATLPFGLVFSDSSDVVSVKLGAGPFRKDKSSSLPEYSAERFAHSHAVGDLVIIAKYDTDLRLMAVYLMQADRNLPQGKRGKEALLKHKIVSGNGSKVEALRNQIPTSRWREAMVEGDELFNGADVAKAETGLNTFLDRVKDATKKADAQAIRTAVRDIVLLVNEINGTSGMIETLERDELGVFIDEVVKAAGFTLQDDEDLTGEWREW